MNFTFCSTEDFDVARLTKKESQHLQRFTSQKRRAQWAAGRGAVHRFLKENLNFHDEVDILSDVSGKPQCLRPSGEEVPLFMSITHGQRWAFATASFSTPVGLDFCEMSHAGRLRNLKSRYHISSSVAEQTDLEIVQSFSLIEAFLKAKGWGLMEGFFDQAQDWPGPLLSHIQSSPFLEYHLNYKQEFDGVLCLLKFKSSDAARKFSRI